MFMIILIVFATSLVGGCWCVEQLSFPPGFMFGASTSAYQVEGAWNVNGKGESIWDRMVHTRPEVVMDRSNGDVACDSYYQWRRDIKMLEELGLNTYRFSISWTRLLPSGYPNHINEDGVRYYSELIDGLLEKGIQPLVTLYHFDLPQSLQDLGGWANPLIVDWFADYARVVYSLYGDRVNYWLTINEPIAICDLGYAKQHGPCLDDTKIGQFLCNKYVLLAHAKAWRIYDEEFRHKYHGKVSVASVFIWFKPKTPDEADITNITIEYWEGRYAYPVFSKEGGWPPRIEKVLAENAKKEGYPQPRLVAFTPEETIFVKGTYDFYALNHYSTRLVSKARTPEEVGPWPFYGSDELGVTMEKHPDWAPTAIDWFGVYPEGLRHQLNWLKAAYGDVDILITENGYPSFETGLNDQLRVDYMKRNFEQILLAIRDGVSVVGYNAWSIMDNFEWLGGYKIRFGMYAVNFSDPLRPRTARVSARYYAGVTRTRGVAHNVLNYI